VGHPDATHISRRGESILALAVKFFVDGVKRTAVLNDPPDAAHGSSNAHISFKPKVVADACRCRGKVRGCSAIFEPDDVKRPCHIHLEGCLVAGRSNMATEWQISEFDGNVVRSLNKTKGRSYSTLKIGISTSGEL
jgi:hypothetical protein